MIFTSVLLNLAISPDSKNIGSTFKENVYTSNQPNFANLSTVIERENVNMCVRAKQTYMQTIYLFCRSTFLRCKDKVHSSIDIPCIQFFPNNG